MLAYFAAIISRSSLSALGPAAQQHFGIDATTLSSFAVIQLLVYALMQIPVGMLLDRFGSSVLLFAGGTTMMLGQLAMATVHEVWLAILARVMIGAGDACIFISVIRMLPEWFSVRQLPVLGQATGLIGQTGQFVSVTPLAFTVAVYGWAVGFLGIVAVIFLVTLLGAIVLRDRPGVGTLLERLTGRLGKRSREAKSLGLRDSTAVLAAVAPPETALIATPSVSGSSRVFGFGLWRRALRLLSIPGVRLAYWVHVTPPFSAAAFLLLWGTPFLTGGLGLERAHAAHLLNLMIVAGMLAGLLLGSLSSRFIERRVLMVVGISVAIMCSWVLVLLWPGTPPGWLLIVLVVVMALGGPASMISFEVARSHTPRSFAGLGTGLVNTGGFTATLLTILFIGLVLDWQGAGSPESYSLTAFRLAFAVQLPLWLAGLTMMLVEMRRTRRWMRDHGRSLR